MNNNAKKKKTDRQSLYVTVIVILMMVAVVVAVATSLAKNPGVAPDTSETTDKTDLAVPSPDTEDVFFGDDDKKEDTDAEETADTQKSPEKDTQKTDSDTEKTESVSGRLPVFVAPVKGEILKGASLTVPVFSQTMEDYRTHSGVDVYCNSGSDIAAAAAGTIKKIWDDPMMGMSVSIEHSGGAVTVYQNLYDELPDGIEEGCEVRAGQIIATAGDSALMEIAEESHLHFALIVNGEYVDPSEYIEFSATPVFAD